MFLPQSTGTICLMRQPIDVDSQRDWVSWASGVLNESRLRAIQLGNFCYGTNFHALKRNRVFDGIVASLVCLQLLECFAPRFNFSKHACLKKNLFRKWFFAACTTSHMRNDVFLAQFLALETTVLYQIVAGKTKLLFFGSPVLPVFGTFIRSQV